MKESEIQKLLSNIEELPLLIDRLLVALEERDEKIKVLKELLKEKQ